MSISRKTDAPMIQRNRTLYLVLTLVIVAIGLASRKYPSIFPDAFGKFPGDALWALMVFTGWGMITPRRSTAALALTALLCAYADELSQLYQAPWINAIRATTAGHLVLGSTFSWGDMIAYTIGIAFGCGIETVVYRIRRRSASRSLFR